MSNLILVGEPGVGKTGIVEGFAQLMTDGKLPEDFGRPAVIEISLTSLVAGTKYRGEFEERLEAVVREAFDEGTLTDAQGKKCDFRESVIILTSNLGSGGGAVKPFIGFVAGDQPAISPDQANERREEEAIRKHLRPELLNRLSKVVHFKPLGMETAREVLGKLIGDFNKRLENVVFPEQACGETPQARPAAGRGSHVRVELTASAEELILREGYSEQYGARNLERAVDRLLGTLIAEALLGGKIAAAETIRLEAVDGRIQFCEDFYL